MNFDDVVNTEMRIVSCTDSFYTRLQLLQNLIVQYYGLLQRMRVLLSVTLLLQDWLSVS